MGSFVVGADVLDRILRRVFAASLPLASARSMTNGNVAARLDEAIAELDDLVSSIRHTALSAHTAHSVDIEAVRQGPGPTGDGHDGPNLVDEAARAIEQLEALLGALWVDAIAGTDGDPSQRDRIGNAARLVRLARRTLTASALR
jgi:hypothetical protein